MKRVAFHTLGCKLNLTESSVLGRQFRQRGYHVVGIDEPADVCVINTCSVTERADRECRQIVRRARRHSPGAFVVVTGCYAQLQPNEVAAIGGVDLVLGSREKLHLFEHSHGFRRNGSPRVVVTPANQLHEFEHASSLGNADRTRAFLKIQDGCDYTCSFCTIPLARGESRSVPVPAILTEARAIVTAGYKEIVLTGVNVGDYGRKIGTTLLELLRSLVRIEGLERIRISSIEPNLLTDELLDFWLREEKLCKHFHLPLQSGSDPVLRAMRRRYLSTDYVDRVEKIKRSSPHAGIGADVIVGFPGETTELFEETYRLLVELPISYLHVFPYSPRPNTPASTREQNDPRVRHERSERLRLLGLRKRRAFYESFIGRDVLVLLETEDARRGATGLTGEYVRVNLPTATGLLNRLVAVRIVRAKNECCEGVLLDSATEEIESSYTQVGVVQ